MNNLVPSFDTCKALKAAGWDKPTYFLIHKNGALDYNQTPIARIRGTKWYAAPTAQEVKEGIISKASVNRFVFDIDVSSHLCYKTALGQDFTYLNAYVEFEYPGPDGNTRLGDCEAQSNTDCEAEALAQLSLKLKKEGVI